MPWDLISTRPRRRSTPASPRQPLPSQTDSAPTPGGEAQALVVGADLPFEWWELFQCPALNSLIDKAFKANPSIVAAQAALRQAHEVVRAQQGFYYPSVEASYQAERHKIAGNLTNDQAPGIQGNGDNLLPPLQDPNHPPFTAPLYYSFQTAEVSVGFVPDVFGGNRRQVESLSAQAEAQRFALEATYITLASNVAAAAIQEASLRAQIKATQLIIAADQKSVRILRDELRLGFSMRIDVAVQETVLAQAKAALPPLQMQFEQNRDLIRALVGNLPNDDVPETFELDALRLPPEIPMSLPAKIIEQTPGRARRRGPVAQRQRPGGSGGRRDAAAVPHQWLIRRQRRPIRLVVSFGRSFLESGRGHDPTPVPGRNFAAPKASCERGPEAIHGSVPKHGDHRVSEHRRLFARLAVRCGNSLGQCRIGEGRKGGLRPDSPSDGRRLRPITWPC